MNEKNATARAEIKISLFTAPEFGNAISICTVWPKDIYCFGLSFLYCGVSFIPSSRLWCYHLLITSSSLRHSGQLHHFRGSNMWTWWTRRWCIMQWLHFKMLAGKMQSCSTPYREWFREYQILAIAKILRRKHDFLVKLCLIIHSYRYSKSICMQVIFYICKDQRRAFFFFLIVSYSFY